MKIHPNRIHSPITELAFLLSLAIPMLTFTLAATPPDPTPVLVNRDKAGLGIQGYDPVAYFTDGKPVLGDPKFASMHEGVTYRFANAAHKETFDAAPAQYAPAYGGYCGYAISINRLSPISPQWFQVIDGRLVLQHNKTAFSKWNADLPGNSRKADGNWPDLVAQHGTVGHSLVFTDRKGIALGGYDPVTYLSGKPLKGRTEIEATYNGALYHFVTQENRAAFETDPRRYAPAYGGFCGYAASIGKVRPADPLIWSIVDGQLVVQHTRGAARLWEKDATGNKHKADRLWPRLVEAKAGTRNPIDSLTGRSVLASLD